MFPDNKEFREAAHIGEELFEDDAYEIERQCMSVQRALERNLFPLENALKAYNVTREQYEDFLAQNMFRQLKANLPVQSTSFNYGTYFDTINRMLHLFAGQENSGNLKHLDPVFKELSKLSQDIEQKKVTFEYH